MRSGLTWRPAASKVCPKSSS